MSIASQCTNMKSDIVTVRNAMANVSRTFYVVQANGDYVWWEDDSSWNPFADIEKRVGEVADAHMNTNYVTPTVFANPQPKRRKKTSNFGKEANEERVPANIWAEVKGQLEMKEKLERMINLTVTFVAKEAACA